jgi:hypothetical protein
MGQGKTELNEPYVEEVANITIRPMNLLRWHIKGAHMEAEKAF